jgi:hypothetical protein
MTSTTAAPGEQAAPRFWTLPQLLAWVWLRDLGVIERLRRSPDKKGAVTLMLDLIAARIGAPAAPAPPEGEEKSGKPEPSPSATPGSRSASCPGVPSPADLGSGAGDKPAGGIYGDPFLPDPVVINGRSIGISGAAPPPPSDDFPGMFSGSAEAEADIRKYWVGGELDITGRLQGRGPRESIPLLERLDLGLDPDENTASAKDRLMNPRWWGELLVEISAALGIWPPRVVQGREAATAALTETAGDATATPTRKQRQRRSLEEKKACITDYTNRCAASGTKPKITELARKLGMDPRTLREAWEALGHSLDRGGPRGPVR